LLYDSCGTVKKQSSSDLAILACDSGSDKAFDFLGAAKIIEMVKEIILSFWDRVVFFREKKQSERLKLVAESLPIIDEIGSLESQQKLSREQAELLRRNIIKGTNKFISVGAVIPEIEETTVYEPRKLLKPEPKLLIEPAKTQTAAKPEIETKGDKFTDDSDDSFLDELNELSDAEKEKFLNIFNKMGKEAGTQKKKDKSK